MFLVVGGRREMRVESKAELRSGVASLPGNSSDIALKVLYCWPSELLLAHEREGGGMLASTNRDR
ncbi:MAG: hypothetical protein ACK4XJ_10970, partial [Fimbriimonadaceae bacterium]